MRLGLCRDCLYVWDVADEGATALRCPCCGFFRVVAHADLRALGIAHVDCDSFYASVEKRDRPELRSKPLLIGGDGPRSVVATACYLARAYGCRSAMPMPEARSLCPEAVVLRPDPAKYAQVSRDVHAIFHAYADAVEAVALDEAYLDLRHRDDVPEALSDIALRIEQEVGITVSVGLSSCKFLAKLASELEKPRGFAVISPREARAFLAPRPVRQISGVGPATERRLRADGFATIGDLQKSSELQLAIRYGRHGRDIWFRAQGIDNSPVESERAAKSISAETTFPTDTSSPEDLLTVLRLLAGKVERRMKSAGVAATAVQLKLKTSGFRQISRQVRLADPTQRGDVLLAAVAPLVRRESKGRTFRLAGIGGERLTASDGADPPSLFSSLERPAAGA